MERVYEEAFSEVDEIIKLMPIDISSKIPQKFRQVISENKALNYKTNIQEPIKEQDLKPETVTILGLIYRDYLASPEIKEKLQKEDEEQLKILDPQYLIRIKKESYGYECLTDQKQFYLENYPKIVIEKETIDQI